MQNASILSQFHQGEHFSLCLLHIRMEGLVETGRWGKTFFPALQKLVKAIFLSADISQWCSCSVSPAFTFNGMFWMGVYVAKGSQIRPFLPLLFGEIFTFLILKFHFLTYDLLSPWLLWMIAFLSGTICIKLLTITGIFIVLKRAHRSSQQYRFYFHSLQVSNLPSGALLVIYRLIFEKLRNSLLPTFQVMGMSEGSWW